MSSIFFYLKYLFIYLFFYFLGLLEALENETNCSFIPKFGFIFEYFLGYYQCYEVVCGQENQSL